MVVPVAAQQRPVVRDLSLLVAPNLPCTWSAGMPPVQINHDAKIGPTSAYNRDILTIDEHTGTQWDAPAHFIPKPETGLPHAGEMGYVTADKVPVAQMCGEACVIDCGPLLDKATPGKSPLVTKQHVEAWEKQHRPLGPGDVVIFRSGFSDKYYKPYPDGRRFIADPLQGATPGWPDPDPDCMFYLASKGVKTAATDSPSMGPLPGEMAALTHQTGLGRGMIWTEGVIDADTLPATGAFYAMVGPNHQGGSGAEGRALAVVDSELAATLIASARQGRVADLSVLLAEDRPVWWPGRGVGNHRQPYYGKMQAVISATNPYFAQTHTMDSHTGTHLVPPSFALPAEGFDNSQYAPEVQKWLAEYEAKFGKRGTSDVTTDKVPLEQTCGWARVIDVRKLVGTTDKSSWPASPQITAEHVKQYEAEHGELKPDEIVIFQTGHVEQHFQPLPAGEACLANPLNGKSEGWPAVTAEAVVYLAERGIRCVATDAPTWGGVDEKLALLTYWALGSKGMVGVEYLNNVSKLSGKAFFIFAPVKIKGCHGGPGRAIALD
jgi:kynurenine formamidase